MVKGGFATRLNLPYKARRKTQDEVVFVIVTAQGLTTKVTFPKIFGKGELQQKREAYHSIIEHPMIVLNLKKRMNKSRKMDTIAHEVAHFMLGHHKTLKRTKQRKKINERRADDQAEKWGFKWCYKDYNF